MRRVWFILAIALASAACGSGGDADPYTATDLVTGDEVSVDSLWGEPALLVSWTTWCTQCDEELEGLAEFAASPEADGLEIVAVNLDAADVEDEIAAKVAEHGLTTALWRDRRNDFRREFGAIGVPTTVLLDAEGEVVGTFPGAVDFQDTAVIEALDELRRS
jgi:thiol-disulfide isomerase/thioredoxin